MRARSQGGWWAAALVGVVGCSEPSDVVPVAPPGLEMKRVPQVAVGEPQAIGEQGTSAPKQASTPIPSAISGAVSPPTEVGKPTKTASGLEYVTLKEGLGPEVKAGQTVSLHYVGTLTDGKKFDSSRDRNSPMSYAIGVDPLIRGWAEGVPGMHVGEVRKLTIPPDLAYGAETKKGIPANSTLNFDIEILSVK